MAKWSKIILAAAIAIVGVALFEHSQRVNLSARFGDSILRVESITVAPTGQVHTYFVAPFWRRKFDELWLRWIGPSPFPPASGMSAGLSSDDDVAAVFWVTRKIKSGSIDPGIRKIEIIDEHGCVFTNAYASTVNLSAGPAVMVVAAASFAALPRREQIFSTKIYCHDSAEPVYLRLPNPFPHSYAHPEAEPLPIVRRHGNLEFVLTGFKIEPSDTERHFYAGLEVRTNGVSHATGWGEASVEFEDFTGNHLRSELCRHETNYKVTGRFYRSADASFDPAEIWKFKVKVPQTAECLSTDLKHELPNGKISITAIMSNGEFQFSNDGAHTTIGPAPAVGKSWLYKSEGTGSRIRTPGIALLVPPGIPGNCRLLVRARDQEGKNLSARAVRGNRDYVVEITNENSAREITVELMIEKPFSVEYIAHPEIAAPAPGEQMSRDPDSNVVY